MFQPWRLELRRARAALESGQLDEAGRLLRQGNLQQYQPAHQLSVQLAEGLAQRARQHALSGNSTAGWRDWRAARELAGDTRGVISLRDELAAQALAQVEAHLGVGDIEGALKRLHRLEERHGADARVRSWRQATMRLQAALNLARRGCFDQAERHLEAAAELSEGSTVLAKWKKLFEARKLESQKLEQRMCANMAAGRWPRVLAQAQRLLELAPEHKIAQRARKRAWAEAAAAEGLPTASEEADSDGHHEQQQQHRRPAMSKGSESQPPATRGDRLLLWIDAVGGYLVCLGDEVSLGQAVPTAAVDVPIMGDLSRRHARIRRSGEGYVIEPFAEVRVDGDTIDSTTPLSDGDEIELAEGVRLLFRQSHPLSATARLDFVSRHRTHPSVSGVLLMAESCVLGPHVNNHVVCRDWPTDVVLHRQGDQLHCRAMCEVEIDGELCDGGGELKLPARVAAEDFTFSVEIAP